MLPPVELRTAPSPSSSCMSSVKVLCLVRARFAFKGVEAEGHLSFEAGDVFPITAKEPSGWWEGVIDNCIGWCPSTFLETLASSGVAQVMEAAPKTVRVSADKAKELLESLRAQEAQVTVVEEKQKQHKERKKRAADKKPTAAATAKSPGAKRSAFFLKKKETPSSPREAKVTSPRKWGAGKKEKEKEKEKEGGKRGELVISGPIGFVHKTHLTSEQAEDSERLLQEAAHMGLTQTTATRLIYGETRPSPHTAAGSPDAAARSIVPIPAKTAAATVAAATTPATVSVGATPPEEESMEQKRLRCMAKQLPPEPPSSTEEHEEDTVMLAEEEHSLRMLACSAELLLPAPEDEQDRAEGELEGGEAMDEADDLANLVGESSALLETLASLHSGGIGQLDVPARQLTGRFPAKPPPPPPPSST